MIRGLAVMLMVFHHLFAFPERISHSYFAPLDFAGLHLETILAYYGRICISIFAFLTGYGMIQKEQDKEYQSIRGGYGSAMRQLTKFLLRFWLVYVIWVPLGIVRGSYEWEARTFFRGLLGLNSKYNQEWWYVSEYIKILLVFPIAAYLIRRCKNSGYITCAITGVSLFFSMKGNTFANVFLCSFVGMIAAEYRVFDVLDDRLRKRGRIAYIALMVCCIGILAGRVVCSQGTLTDFFYAPILIWVCACALKSKYCLKICGAVLKAVGRYSTYIWLTHTFFAYYYFQKLCFAPYYSWLIFAWCLLLSALSGIVLEPIVAGIERHLRVMKA